MRGVRLKTPDSFAASAQEPAREGGAADTPWTHWLHSMQENSIELQKAIELEDMESGLRLAAARGQLIYDQLPQVWRFAPKRCEIQEIKRFLESIVLENQNFIERLIGRCRERTEELKSVKRGRKALRLYRNPPAATPRFLDRLG